MVNYWPRARFLGPTGALFVAMVKRACADRGIPIALSQPLYASRS